MNISLSTADVVQMKSNNRLVGVSGLSCHTRAVGVALYHQSTELADSPNWAQGLISLPDPGRELSVRLNSLD